MTVKLSTALRNSLLGTKVTRTDGGSEIAFVNAGGLCTDTTNALLTDGFRPGQIIEVTNSSGGTNDGYYSITSVASDGSQMVISPAPTDEAAAAATPTIEVVHGLAFKDTFKDGCIRIYSGSQPADADAAETGTLLVEITSSGGTLTPGTATNGIEFDAIAAGVLSKKTAETWSGTASNTGTAGYFRLYDNARHTGLDSTYYMKRIDGSCGVSGADLNMSSTSIVSAATITIDSFDVTLPAS
jgi:hypothetical protein